VEIKAKKQDSEMVPHDSNPHRLAGGFEDPDEGLSGIFDALSEGQDHPGDSMHDDDVSDRDAVQGTLPPILPDHSPIFMVLRAYDVGIWIW
jgi:hypothetical protein